MPPFIKIGPRLELNCSDIKSLIFTAYAAGKILPKAKMPFDNNSAGMKLPVKNPWANAKTVLNIETSSCLSITNPKNTETLVKGSTKTSKFIK